MRMVDTRGQQCPAPLIATKRAIRESGPDEQVIVLTDNKTSLENISRFLKDNNRSFMVEENNGTWSLTIAKSESGMPMITPADSVITGVPHFLKGDFVIALSSDRMGDGDEELGTILIVNFFKAIKDLEVLPSKIVMYNSGVKLGLPDSPVNEHLMDLERMGVEIYFCATCVNHYLLADKIKTGTLSNMFEIATIMASAGKVLKP